MSESGFYDASTPSQSIASSITSEIPHLPQSSTTQDLCPPSPPSPVHIVICQLCSKIFLEPVTFECGHTFCLACSERWKEEEWKCPQAGCDEPLGQPVPNLIIKEAAISHRTLMQQQLIATLQSAVIPSHSPMPINDENQPTRQQGHWSGLREVGVRKSCRRIQRDPNQMSNSLSVQRTHTDSDDSNMPPIEKLSIQGSLCPPRETEKRQTNAYSMISKVDKDSFEKSANPPVNHRFIPHKVSPFVRGMHTRKSDMYQLKGKPSRQSIYQRSLKYVLKQPKDYHPDLMTDGLGMGQTINDHPSECPAKSSKNGRSFWKRLFTSSKKPKK